MLEKPHIPSAYQTWQWKIPTADDVFPLKPSYSIFSYEFPMIFPGVPEGCPGVVADTGGGLSSILSGSFFGKVDDDLNDARRT